MKKLFMLCIIPLLFAACVTTGEQVQPDPAVLTITRADIETLNAELIAAQKAVQALPQHKEWKKLEAQFQKRATTELQKLPLWKEWKATEKKYDAEIGSTEEFKRLNTLQLKARRWNALINKK